VVSCEALQNFATQCDWILAKRIKENRRRRGRIKKWFCEVELVIGLLFSGDFLGSALLFSKLVNICKLGQLDWWAIDLRSHFTNERILSLVPYSSVKEEKEKEKKKKRSKEVKL